MPRGHKPGSRTSSAAAAQSTISFGSKSRVTKPSAAPTHASAKKIKHDIVEPIVSDVSTEEIQTPEPDVEKKPTTAEIAIREQTKREFQAPTRDEVEEQALKLSNAQLKKYWKAREDERKVPRGMFLLCHEKRLNTRLTCPSTVHQEDLSMNEKILRHFDLSSQYGVC